MIAHVLIKLITIVPCESTITAPEELPVAATIRTAETELNRVVVVLQVTSLAVLSVCTADKEAVVKHIDRVHGIRLREELERLPPAVSLSGSAGLAIEPNPV